MLGPIAGAVGAAVITTLEAAFSARLARYSADVEATAEITDELRRRIDALKSSGVIDENEVSNLDADIDAVYSLREEVNPLRTYPNWLVKTVNWIPAVPLPAAAAVSWFMSLIPLLVFFHARDGLKTALAIGLSTFLISAVGVVAFLAVYRLRARGLDAVARVLFAAVLVFVPVVSYGYGRLSAYGEWQSDKREDRFQTIVLYSDHQLADDWVESNGVFRSPELMLLRKFGSTFLVFEGHSRERLNVIPTSTIIRAQYFR